MDENQNNYSYGENQNNNQSNYSYGGGQYPQYEEQPSGNRGMAIASLVVGILSILCCCCAYLSVILGIVGIVLAVLSRPKDGKFEGVAMGGLICSIVGLVLGVIIIIVNIVTQNSADYTQMMDMYMQMLQELE